MAIDDAAGLGTAEAEISSLKAQIEQLRLEFDTARRHVGPSMKAHQRCPACGCNKILHSPSVLDRSDSGRERLSLHQPSIWSAAGIGELEVFVCSACGLVEWYVKNVSTLTSHPELFRIIEGSGDDDGPYR